MWPSWYSLTLPKDQPGNSPRTRGKCYTVSIGRKQRETGVDLSSFSPLCETQDPSVLL